MSKALPPSAKASNPAAFASSPWFHVLTMTGDAEEARAFLRVGADASSLTKAGPSPSAPAAIPNRFKKDLRVEFMPRRSTWAVEFQHQQRQEQHIKSNCERK
jgi:hypothetical protein